MIKSIKTYFESLLGDFDHPNTEKQHSVELATAVLMIEISLADEHIHDDERQVIKTQLMEHFGIDEAKINTLIELAENEVDHAVSLYEFTHLLNEVFNADEKRGVVESLWRVAYADAVVDKYEEYYIRKVADLLYVPHSSYIKAKLNASGQ